MSELPRQRRIIVEALEPRLMFSATADIAVFHDSSADVSSLADAVDLAYVYNLPDESSLTYDGSNAATQSDPFPVETADQAEPADLAQVSAARSAPDLTTSVPPSALSVDMVDAGLVAMAAADGPTAAIDTLSNAPVFVFVDITVDNYQALVQDIQENNLGQNINIVYLRPDQDGFQQIADALGSQTHVAAIHLITHGSADAFQLGSDKINQDTIAQHAADFSTWQKSLDAKADILIYGCDVAASEAGQQLIAQIGQLTQADVAASSDLTGSAARNGDWDLEFHYGDVETNVLISAQAQQAWSSIMVADVHHMEQLVGTSSQQFYNNNNVGQQFLVSGSGTFTLNQVGVQLKVLPGANYQEVTILIRSTWNNATNIAMSTNVVASTSMSSDFQWYAFDFSNIVLNKNQNYVIQMYTVYPTNFGATTDGKVAAAYVANPGVMPNTQMVSGINSGTFSGGDLAFILAYDNGNQTPYVNTPIADQNATEKVAFSYQFTATHFKDDDFQDRLTYTATLANGAALPSWLSFNPSTLTFSGTPGVNDAGTIAVKVTASDGQATTSDTFNIAIANNNVAPVVANAIPDQNASEDVAFNFQLSSSAFNDADADPLSYTATLAGGGALPSWLTFNAATQTFSGTPGNGDVGSISVQVTANDNQGGTISDTFTITTANTNDAPTLANLIPNRAATEDSAFSFQFAANTFADIDAGDTLTYSATLANGTALPAWLSFNAATRTFSGTPTNGDVGTIAVKVTASDGNGGTVSDTFDIVVSNINDAPVVANPIPDHAATEDASFNFQFASNTFNDVDAGDSLTYTATLSGGGPLPSWLTFNAATRSFSGTPTNGDVGTLSIEVTAYDSQGGTVADSFDIVIANTNDAPVVANSIPDRSATEDQAFSYQFPANTFSDIDTGASLTYSATLSGGGALPAWLTFNAATRTFSGTPLNGDVGTLSVQVTANDGQGGTIADTFDIVIANSNDAPVVANTIVNQAGTQDLAFNFQFASNTFSDVDLGDTLSYTATLSGGAALPSWLSFNAATRTFSGTPSSTDVGAITVQVTASDGQGGAINTSFDIVIANINDAPVVAHSIPDRTAVENIAFSYQFPANTFSDVDGDILTYSAQVAGGGPLPAWLSFNPATRTFSGTPAPTDVGATIEVIASDGSLTASDTFVLSITNVNNAPTTDNPIPDQNATEDAAFNFQFASNTFGDVDVTDTLTYTASLAGGAPLPSWLTFNAATRTFSGTPLNANVGTLSIEVTADDGNLTVTDTFAIVVANSNDAPTVATPIPNQSATEDSAFNFQFSGTAFNDMDLGNTLSYSATLAGGAPLPSWLTFNAATRTFSGTPLNANVGTISIEVTADDGNGGSVSDLFDIVVANSNDTPTVATPIPNQSATEDSAFNFQFSGTVFNDVDVGDTLTYTATLAGGAPLPSWLTFNAATRTFSGTPLNSNVGTISIEVTAEDGNGGSVSDLFDIVVANSNDAPTVATPIPNQNAIEDVAFSFQFSGTAFNDMDGDTLTYTAQLSGGSALPAWLSFNPATRTFSGTPLNSDVGSLSVQIIADDGQGSTVTETFAIAIANSNDAPVVANTIANQAATEDTAFNFQFAANTFSDADIGNSLSYTATLAGGASLPSWLSFDAATRTFSGTPLNDDVGTVSLEVTANDSQGGTVVASFAIIIANSNDAPTLANAIPDQNATEDTAFNFQFASNVFSDQDIGDTLSYTATLAGGAALPSWLTFDPSTRTFYGTPLNEDVGTVTLQVTASDGQGGSISDTFAIVVGNSNDAPTLANPIPDQIASEDSPFNFQFAANTFNDLDIGNSLAFTASLSSGGALPAWLSFNAATRTFSGTPLNSDLGTVSIRVTASDGQGGITHDLFTITVANSNDAPTLANSIPDQTATQDAVFNFQIAANTFADEDTASVLTYSATLTGGAPLPSWLNFDAATRSFSGTPTNSDVGSLSIEVTASDGSASASDIFAIAIGNINDAPVLANSMPNQHATEDSLFTYQIPGNTFVDIDLGSSLSYSATLVGGGALPAWLSFDANTRTFSGTPANQDVGPVAIQVSVADGLGGIASDSFTVDVLNSNDAPVLVNAIPDQAINEDSAFNFQFASNTFSDQDLGNTLSYTAQLVNGAALPDWLTFDAATRTFSGTPLNADVGNLSILVTASDGEGGSLSTRFELAVVNTPDAPQLATPIKDIAIEAKRALVYTIPSTAFHDEDLGDSLTYSTQLLGGGPLPTWLTFDAATRTFGGTPAVEDIGSQILIELKVTDSTGNSASDSFMVSVERESSIYTPEKPLDNVARPGLPETPAVQPPDITLVDNRQTADDGSITPVTDDSSHDLSDQDSKLPLLLSLNEEAPEVDKNNTRLMDIRSALGAATHSPLLAGLIAPDAGFSTAEADDFNNALRRFHSDMNEIIEAEEMQKTILSGITFSVTTGLIIWSLRASSLLLTLMSMIPLWSGMDPLPILDQINKRKQKLEQERRDRQREDKNANEVGYLFDRDPSRAKVKRNAIVQKKKSSHQQ